MSAQEVIEQIEALPRDERTEVIKKTLADLCPQSGKVMERLLRRLENPDIPEDVWRGIEDAEDGRLIDLDEALTELDRP
ncbi:MAG: hypothetical protein ABIR24_04605 [Verrucomicrobiota bacterium]